MRCPECGDSIGEDEICCPLCDAEIFDQEERKMTTPVHPHIAELAKELLALTNNLPERPTAEDYGKLMSVRSNIKNFGDRPDIELSESDRTDWRGLCVIATKEANRQEEFYENNDNQWAA